MKKMQQISTIHKCGKQMDMRIADVKDEVSKSGEILAWMIYGVCKKCKEVLMSSIIQQSEKPIKDVDYTLVNEVAEE